MSINLVPSFQGIQNNSLIFNTIYENLILKLEKENDIMMHDRML